MKPLYKALIFSAIVFPGAGYFILQRRARGWIALGVTLACLFVLLQEANHKAQIIAQKILDGSIPLDVDIIREQILHADGLYSATSLSLVTGMIGVTWLVGMTDAYRIGRQLEKTAR